MRFKSDDEFQIFNILEVGNQIKLDAEIQTKLGPGFRRAEF